MSRLGDIVLDATRNVRHVAEPQSHRDDAPMDANLTDEGADESGAQVVEARPVASYDRKSDRIAHHFSKNGDVGGFTLDRLRRNLVRREDEILSRRIDEPDVGKPVGQAGSETRKFGRLTLDSHDEATILLEPSVHRRKAVAYAASASETESPLARMSKRSAQMPVAISRSSRSDKPDCSRHHRAYRSRCAERNRFASPARSMAVDPVRFAVARTRMADQGVPPGAGEKTSQPTPRAGTCFHPRPRGRGLVTLAKEE